MKKFLFVFPALILIVAITYLISPKVSDKNLEATMLTIGEPIVYDSVESIMADATFYVKGKMIAEEDYVQGTSYRYKFQLIEDYVGNMRFDNNEDLFYVYSMVSAQYDEGETYYLFMNAFEAYMAGVIMYETVDSSCVIQDNQTIFSEKVEVQLNSNDSQMVAFEKKSFESDVSTFVEINSEEIKAKTLDTFKSDEITSLEFAYDYADAIWKITIVSIVEEANPNAGIYEYRIDEVYRGNTETAPEGSVFYGIYPTEETVVNNQYYVLLSDIGDYQYEPASFDFWLFPVNTPETNELVEMIAADE